jgi:hypothetical protein
MTYNQISLSQNIEFEKTLDTSIDFASFGSISETKIQYYKVRNKSVLRIDNNKIQLYDADCNLKWEDKLDEITTALNGYIGDYAFTDEFIYVVQNQKISTLAKTRMILTRYSYNGEKSVIEFDSKSTPFLAIYNIEIIDNQIYLIGMGPTSPTSYSVTPIAMVNADFTGLEKTFTLPLRGMDNDLVMNWKYLGIVENDFRFEEMYQQKEDGKWEKCYYCNGPDIYVETFIINPDLTIIDRKRDNPTNIASYIGLNLYPKYDTSLYQLTTNNSEVIICPQLSYSIRVDDKKPDPPIYLESNNKKSKDIVKSIRSMGGLEALSNKTNTRLVFENIIFDPINNYVNIFLSIKDNPIRLMLVYNESLELRKVIKYYPTPPNRFYCAQSDAPETYIVSINEQLQSWGELPSEYTMTAIEYAMNNGRKLQNSIINFDDYQLLFQDNVKTKTTTVRKFIK